MWFLGNFVIKKDGKTTGKEEQERRQQKKKKKRKKEKEKERKKSQSNPFITIALLI